MADAVRAFLTAHALDQYAAKIVDDLCYDHLPTLLALTPAEIEHWAAWMPEGHRKRFQLTIEAEQRARSHVVASSPAQAPQPRAAVRPPRPPTAWPASGLAARPFTPPATVATPSTPPATAARPLTPPATAARPPPPPAAAAPPASSSSSHPATVRLPHARFHERLDDERAYPSLHRFRVDEEEDDDSPDTPPLCIVDGEQLPASLSTWRLQDLYCGTIGFATGRLQKRSPVHAADNRGRWILCPLSVQDSEDLLEIVADDLRGVLFRLAEGCLCPAGDTSDEVTAHAPSATMMQDGRTLHSVRARATSMHLVYDQLAGSLVGTAQGLLLFHKRKDDRLLNLYLVCLPLSRSAGAVQEHLQQLHKTIAQILGSQVQQVWDTVA